ncbi:MAG: metalloregulator ArsR/SmtB family transcription factor [Spirochaetales bacterium]|nr:metalloregulator ArsR/SmtB family transcription factor [Spirochaetales bacterium]
MHTAELFRLLSDSTRLRCVKVLGESTLPLCVAELADILQKPQYATSRALSELRKADLVQEDRQGQLRMYSLNCKPLGIQELSHWIASYCDCSHDSNADNCAFDSERLAWRLDLRQRRSEILTYRPASPEAITVLFVCVHNSARSQFAEAYVNQLGYPNFLAESAGLQAGTLNPYVVQVLEEEGIDIRHKQPRAVDEVYALGRTYDWVITVCDPEAEKNCPVFPGPVQRLSWPFPDPCEFKGEPEEVLKQVRQLGKSIYKKVQEFLETEKFTKERIQV